MKKVVLILFTLVLVLYGCTSPSTPYARTDLKNNGYDVQEGGYYLKEINEQSVALVYVNNVTREQVGIGVEYYPTSDQMVNLEYDFENDLWSAAYYNDSALPYLSNGTQTLVAANEAYAYINDVSPDTIVEITKQAEYINADMTSLQGGNVADIEDILK